MESLIIFRYLHFIALFGFVSSVVAQHLLLKDRMTRAEIKRVSIVDAFYGISALLVLAVGLVLWFGVGKPAEFYTTNWIFHLKVTLFLVAALLSIIPTRFFLKSRKGDQQEVIELPKQIILIIRIELVILFVIPLLAVLMAQGVK